MTQKIFNVRFQLRNNTEAEWKDKIGFVPLQGEPCVTTDGDNKGRIKIGDGTSTWQELPYVTSPATGAYVTATELQTALEKYASIEDLQAGKISVTIPIATASNTGSVKSSNAQNGVTVNEDGTMTVNNLSIAKVENDDTLTVILNGGDANTLQ